MTNLTIAHRKAFPRAAKANRALFFCQEDVTRKQKALTVAEVHGRINAMIDQRVARYTSIRQDRAPGLAISLLSYQRKAPHHPLTCPDLP